MPCAGSYAAIPALLSAPVIEVEELIQSEETRKRLKFLRHLPLSAEFQLVEVDLSGVLPPEALAPFAAELAEREKRRQKRSKALAREAARDARREAADARSQQVGGLSFLPLPLVLCPSLSLCLCLCLSLSLSLSVSLSLSLSLSLSVCLSLSLSLSLRQSSVD